MGMGAHAHAQRDIAAGANIGSLGDIEATALGGF